MGQVQPPDNGTLRRVCSTSYCEQSPRSWDALQHVLAAILELDAGANDKILDCPGDQDLAWRCQRTYPSGNVDGQTPQIVASHLTLTCVKTQVKIDPERRSGVGNGQRTANRPRGPIERGNKPITRCIDLLAAESLQLFTDHTVMVI